MNWIFKILALQEIERKKPHESKGISSFKFCLYSHWKHLDSAIALDWVIKFFHLFRAPGLL